MFRYINSFKRSNVFDLHSNVTDAVHILFNVFCIQRWNNGMRENTLIHHEFSLRSTTTSWYMQRNVIFMRTCKRPIVSMNFENLDARDYLTSLL